ncbi:MAG TPA: hypothetical protein VLG76_08370 [Rhabdochlamydiaceae bacterium]|nr:hypothetical protein [Rhabdochlamydiaceae bacterium]
MSQLITSQTASNISQFLSTQDLLNASASCKAWNKSFKEGVFEKQFEQLPKASTSKDQYEQLPNAFTPKDYETHFGVKVVDPISLLFSISFNRMCEENNKPDPDDSSEKIGKTHLWIYRPKEIEINRKTTTLTTVAGLKQLVTNPRRGKPEKLYRFDDRYGEIGKDVLMGDSGWCLIRKNVFQRTLGVCDDEDVTAVPFDRQVEIINASGYTCPSGRDVMLTTLVWRIKTGERLYPLDVPKGKVVYTWAADPDDESYIWQVSFGRKMGLCIKREAKSSIPWGVYFVGLTGIRKLT